MAVKLRLVRMGKKKQPTYRVVAADSRSPRDGRFLEVVGTYAPRGRSGADREAVVTIDQDRALRWLREGAQPTERVERLLKSSGVMDRLGSKGAADISGSREEGRVVASPEPEPEPEPEPDGEDAGAGAQVEVESGAGE